MNNSRVSKIISDFFEDPSEGILVTSRTNCTYLTGFTGSNGYLLVTQSNAVLFTDSRYIEQAALQCPELDVKMISASHRSLVDVVLKNRLNTIYIEPDHISLSEYQTIKNAFGGNISLKYDKKHIVEYYRSTKDPTEICNIAKAVEFSDFALSRAMSFIEPGIKEVQISNLIMETLLEIGSEGVAFDTIVGTGSNAAIPHHTPDHTVIQDPDHVVIDMGAVYQGYRSDITRTVKVGKSRDSRFDEIYGIVLEAQLCAIKASEPGIPANSLDTVAREVIIRYGYGEYFSHGLGHGVGLDVHEKPMVVKSSVDIIDIGSVFTVEPGIYIPGWGGVRIEDMVLLEESGPVVLTKTPK